MVTDLRKSSPTGHYKQSIEEVHRSARVPREIGGSDSIGRGVANQLMSSVDLSTTPIQKVIPTQQNEPSAVMNAVNSLNSNNGPNQLDSVGVADPTSYQVDQTRENTLRRQEQEFMEQERDFIRKESIDASSNFMPTQIGPTAEEMQQPHKEAR